MGRVVIIIYSTVIKKRFQIENHRDILFVLAIVREREQIIIRGDSKFENRYFIAVEYVIFFSQHPKFFDLVYLCTV